MLFFLLLCAVSAAAAAPTVSLNASVTSATSGDTIYLEPTVYSGPENCNVEIRSKHLSLVSRTGEAVIDCEGERRCVVVRGGSSVTMVGVTLRNGNALEEPLARRNVPRSVRDSPLSFEKR